MTYNFKGSEKQIKWAEDIAAEAFGELDALDHNIDNIPGYQLNHEAVEEVRKSLVDAFAQPQMQDAHNVIDKRNMLSAQKIEKMAREVYRDNVVYDAETHTFVARPEETAEGETEDFLAEMLKMKSEVVCSKTFTANDGKSTATAKLTITRNTKTGEVVNSGVGVMTSGGWFYNTQNYGQALDTAQAIVEHWNAGDYEWEPEGERV